MAEAGQAVHRLVVLFSYKSLMGTFNVCGFVEEQPG